MPEDHLAWFVSDTVEQLELDSFVDRYRVCGKGEQAYPPRVMLKILLYAYSVGIFSSRKIAAELETDVAFRVLRAVCSRTSARFAASATATKATSPRSSCRSYRSPKHRDW